MSTSYSTLGEDLYNFVLSMNISGINAEWSSWARTFNRPPKSDEMDDYPCFAVVPTRDEQQILDNYSDDDLITYSVFMFVRFYEASIPEADIRALVDRVRTALRTERRSQTPLGDPYTLSFAGEWGGDENQVERFYRLDVTARIAEDIT